MALSSKIYLESDLNIFRSFKRKQRNKAKVPVFIFLCGGNDEHPARAMVKNYIARQESDSVSPYHNVHCVTAENMAPLKEFKDENLLVQEAMIADASDCIVLFAESVGSFCELGIFSALPSTANILTVCHDVHYARDNSFLQGGPIKMVESQPASLAQSFPLDLECPLMELDFVKFLSSVREKALSEEYWERKDLNSNPDKIAVGGYVHELLDIINYFSPIAAEDVESLYKEIKGFSDKQLTIYSPTIQNSLKHRKGIGEEIKTEQVLAFMQVSKIIRSVEAEDGRKWFFPIIHPEDPFLFTAEAKTRMQFRRAVARIRLRKRQRGIGPSRNVYNHFDN